MACMVAVRVVRGLGAEDSRSDDEEEGNPESPLEDVPTMESSSNNITPDVSMGNGYQNGNGEARKRKFHFNPKTASCHAR